MTADSKRAVDVKKHDNKWTGGDCDFAWVLPPEQRGSVGCRLVTIVVDPAVGNEVCLLVTEDSEFAVGYASVSPVNLLAHTGLVATPHGPVVFIVWQIAAGSSAEFFLKHFLNPASQSHCDLVEQIACQTHLKLIIDEFIN